MVYGLCRRVVEVVYRYFLSREGAFSLGQPRQKEPAALFDTRPIISLIIIQNQHKANRISSTRQQCRTTISQYPTAMHMAMASGGVQTSYSLSC